LKGRVIQPHSAPNNSAEKMVAITASDRINNVCGSQVSSADFQG
jgi:hypothetical protein